MEDKGDGRGVGSCRILPDPYEFRASDTRWDDAILPLDFKQDIRRSIFDPLKKFGRPDSNSFIIFGPREPARAP